MANGLPDPPPPPRLTGDAEADMPAFGEYLHDFYKKTVVAGLYRRVSDDLQTGDFDPSSLPDPASATAASAQQTANNAYTLAKANETSIADIESTLAADKVGTATVSEANTSIAVTFAAAEPDTSYFLAVTPISKSGAPAAGSNRVDHIDKTTGGFTLHVETAPGVGTSVTFDWTLTR